MVNELPNSYKSVNSVHFVIRDVLLKAFFNFVSEVHIRYDGSGCSVFGVGAAL